MQRKHDKKIVKSMEKNPVDLLETTLEIIGRAFTNMGFDTKKKQTKSNNIPVGSNKLI